MLTFPLPSKEQEPVTSEVKEIVLAVANLLAVGALVPQEASPSVELFLIKI
jgi:hypothetical protein